MSDTNLLPPNLEALRHEDLRIAYQELCQSYHAIDDFRAKLLGLLPLVSGTGIFFIGFAGSYTLNLKAKLEKEPNIRREPSKRGNIIDPNVR